MDVRELESRTTLESQAIRVGFRFSSVSWRASLRGQHLVIEAVGTANTSMKIKEIGTATFKILLFLVFPMAAPRLDNFTFHTVFVFCEKSAGNTVDTSQSCIPPKYQIESWPIMITVMKWIVIDSLFKTYFFKWNFFLNLLENHTWLSSASKRG